MPFATDTSLDALSHTIQVAIAPVFLLTGIGSMLGVLTNRLGRIVDRVRHLESSAAEAVRLSEGAMRIELMRLNERKRWVNRAIMLCTLCALLICTLIAAVFVGAFVRVEIGAHVALLFIAAMLALIAGLVCFVREIYIAVNKERVPRGE